jgi:hypothetical protein
MGLFGSILKTGFDAVLFPVDIIKDTVTFGGILTGADEPYCIQKVRKIEDDLQDVSDDLQDLF